MARAPHLGRRFRLASHPGRVHPRPGPRPLHPRRRRFRLPRPLHGPLREPHPDSSSPRVHRTAASATAAAPRSTTWAPCGPGSNTARPLGPSPPPCATPLASRSPATCAATRRSPATTAKAAQPPPPPRLASAARSRPTTDLRGCLRTGTLVRRRAPIRTRRWPATCGGGPSCGVPDDGQASRSGPRTESLSHSCEPFMARHCHSIASRVLGP